MAELVIKINYRSPVRQTLRFLLKCTFPVWGIMAPIAAVFCLTALPFMVLSTPPAGLIDLMCVVSGLLGSIVIPVAGLMATRLLADTYVVLDKDGIQFPVSPANLFVSRYLPWSRLSLVRAMYSAPRWHEGKLIFRDQDGRDKSLALRNMRQEEIEQLLLAVEVWGSYCQQDTPVKDLREIVGSTSASRLEMSYTQMWEEELKRRFSATIFMPLEPGRVLRNGTLKVVRQLALGGLSAVYLCQMNNQRLVVLKEAVVQQDSTESIRSKAYEMFEREAKLLVKLDHPAIVRVQDHFVEDGRNYIVLEQIPGTDLRQYVNQNGKQSEPKVIEWAIQITGILKYLHEQDPPIIHRDLTPDNLVLTQDGSIVLIDFGAANEFISKATGTFVGKHSFIAPEQLRGKAVTQSDIYALGCTLYFLLTGEEPEALSVSAPQDRCPELTADINELVTSCTQMEAADRYQSATQLLPVLRKLAATAFV